MFAPVLPRGLQTATQSNPKLEIRNPKQIQNPEIKMTETDGFMQVVCRSIVPAVHDPFESFEIRILDLFSISIFVFRD
jgi:hypothetical protein